MTIKHTKEPWKWEQIDPPSNLCVIYREKDNNHVSDTSLHNAKRIVDCVNSMAGIEDPAKFIETIRGALTEEWLSENLTNGVISPNFWRGIHSDLFPKETKK